MKDNSDYECDACGFMCTCKEPDWMKESNKRATERGDKDFKYLIAYLAVIVLLAIAGFK